jgi:hypothetical protein
MARYRVTYNVFHFASDKRVSSKAQIVLEVDVPRGEVLKHVAYGEASKLLQDMRFVIGGDVPLGEPVSVEKLRPKKVRMCRCGAVMPDD